MKKWLMLALIFLMFSSINEVSASLSGCSDPNLDTDKNCVELYSCGSLNEANTYYLLMNNVNSDDSCFLIAQNNIVLDLNEYTITYSENPSTQTIPCKSTDGYLIGKYCHFGIVGRGGWNTSIDFPDYLGWDRASNVEIKNGAVIQSPNSESYNEPIRSSDSGKDWNIHDIYLYISKVDTKGLWGGMDMIVNNVTVDTGEISECVNRRDRGYPALEIGTGAIIENNTIINAQHAGIRAGSNSIVRYNYINVDQRGDNAFGFWVGEYKENIEFSYNVINTTNGRGVLLDSSTGMKIHNNYIETYENKMGDPCTGYPTSGTYAFRIRYDSRNHHVYNNTVIANAYGGEGGRGVAIVLSNGIDDSNNTIEENTFIAKSDGTVEGIAVVVENNNESIHPRHMFKNNHIISDDILVNFYGKNERGNNFLSYNDTYELGPNPTATHAWLYFRPEVSEPTETDNINGNIFTNPTLIGLTYEDIYYHPYCDSYDCEFTVKWDSKFNLMDGSSSVQGAMFEVIDSPGEETYTALTDSLGSVYFSLTEFIENGGLRSVKNPYSVDLSYSGWDLSDSVNVNSNQREFYYSMDGSSGCIVNSDCDDDNICTYDVCAAGNCVNPVMPGTSCDDGIECTSHDSCSLDGSCLGMVTNDNLCADRPECDLKTCTQNGCEYSECTSLDRGYRLEVSFSPTFIYKYLTFADLFRIEY